VITSDNGVRSFQVSTPFPSGQMPWYMMAVWYANQHSGLLAAGTDCDNDNRPGAYRHV
jgi:hypothetical protein